ncbi:tetratricopeptide repeat-containing sensor histidine kinase [Tenacibaculum jejuense]|uniref:Putative Signal transduction histidine kinase, LytS n=1 Tax=Tenacibaculum jejuense TaxID=584609 RepID=A0A238U7C0_9FLAO|nr:tetratricopeptide repeat protein [Tenacibaculum jejuense]SNR15099.1 putative Signal transduction histidine kinase, LytS [Tenacibaculum jejuense]
MYLTSLKGQNTVSEKVENNIKTSKNFLLKNLDSAFFYSEKALSFAKETNLDTLITKAQIQKSSVYIFRNEFNKADSILTSLLSKSSPLHIEGQIWHNLATVLYRKRDLEQALKLYVKAASLTEKSQQQQLLLNTYSNIGVINAQLKNYEKAQDYLEKVVDLAEKNELLKLQILSNLANIYRENKKYTKFKKASLEAESLAIKHHINGVLGVIYSNLSLYYTDVENNYNKGLFYGKQSLDLKKKTTNKNLSLTYNNIAHTYLLKKEYQKAITYLDSALPKSNGVLKSYIYNNYKKAYTGLKNYKKALDFSELKDQTKDSLTKKKEKEKITEITEKYESDKKEQQINLLNTKNELQESKIKNQNNLLIGGIVTIFLLGTLLFLWFKNEKTKQSLQKAFLQNKLLQTQLNPHFLFHSLNNIQSYIYKNQKETSLNYLSNYSKLMRSMFENTSKDFITVREDFDAMQAYLNLQKSNFQNNVAFSIESSDEISEYLIPPMLIQPFIENALQHGIKDIENGLVSVSYHNNNDFIRVIVSDNGKGVKSKSNNQLLERYSSSDVIEERIKNLSKTHNYFIQKEIKSNSSGTTVSLLFPKKSY